ncbi:MAG: histidine kinase [Bacteroidota bacterium]
MIIKPKNKLFTYNLLTLLVVFCYFGLKKFLSEDSENLVFFPGGLLLSLAVMSSFWIWNFRRFTHQNSLRYWYKFVGYAVSNGIFLILMADLIILILERFFRLEEHYTISALPTKWITEWYIFFEGIFLFCCYQLLIRFDFIQKNFQLNERKLQSLEEEITNSNLKSLRAELNPHFLYNAMNSIAMMVRVKKYSESIKMIANLNELLRISLNKSQEQFISLKQELEILDKYLQVEMVRFGDKVQVTYTIDEETLQAKVPQLILQPIVENAFKHGMSTDMGRQEIMISSTKEKDQLFISLSNSARGTVSIDLSHRADKAGIGLDNIKNRLRQLYGGKFRFQFEQHAETVEFRIIIPFQI